MASNEIAKEKIPNSDNEKGKAILVQPDSMTEYEQIRNAAEKEKRCLGAFCLFHSLEAARKINNSTAQ